MAIERVYLVISADRRVRAAKRPQIRGDEVAIQINLHYPDRWGKVVHTIDLAVPDFAPARVDEAERLETEQ
jgi:hypothetical protein